MQVKFHVHFDKEQEHDIDPEVLKDTIELLAKVFTHIYEDYDFSILATFGDSKHGNA